MLMTTANLDKNILTSFIHIMLKTKQKKNIIFGDRSENSGNLW